MPFRNGLLSAVIKIRIRNLDNGREKAVSEWHLAVKRIRWFFSIFNDNTTFLVTINHHWIILSPAEYLRNRFFSFEEYQFSPNGNQKPFLISFFAPDFIIFEEIWLAVRYATCRKWFQYRSKKWRRSWWSTFMTPMALGGTIITTCFGTISRCIIIWNIGRTSCTMKLTPMIWTISTQMILKSLF